MRALLFFVIARTLVDGKVIYPFSARAAVRRPDIAPRTDPAANPSDPTTPLTRPRVHCRFLSDVVNEDTSLMTRALNLEKTGRSGRIRLDAASDAREIRRQALPPVLPAMIRR
jgi:hypothetical protein